MNALNIGNIFQNHVLLTAAIAWASCQLIKAPIAIFITKERDWRIMFGDGGMPSSHSAFVVSAAVAVGMRVGWETPIFALCVVLAGIVMADAAGVRRAAGKQAAVLNEILEHFKKTGELVVGQKKLLEFLGHTPMEVLIGALYGALIAVIFQLWVFPIP